MFGKHSLDLEKQFTFYASYHNNPINVLIHILCIWPILATGLVILQVRNYVSKYSSKLNSGLNYLKTTVQKETFLFLSLHQKATKNQLPNTKTSPNLSFCYIKNPPHDFSNNFDLEGL